MTPTYITGIGSRETPQLILTEMQLIGIWCRAQAGRIRVRSGHADGADYAFEQGALEACDVYLPWATFNSDKPLLGVPLGLPFVHRVVEADPFNELVQAYHPLPSQLSNSGWQLMRRNGPQVLGLDLKTPSKAIVCWTRNGTLTGGTSQALRIGAAYSIPVLNMFFPKYNTADAVITALKRILSEGEVQ